MADRQQGGFGKRGMTDRPSAQRPLAGSPKSPHTIYRPGETERPTFHGSFVERNWPKFGAVAFAALALAVYLTSGKTDPVSLVLATLLAGGIGYVLLSKVRASLNDVHMARTEIFTSPSFAVGAFAGLGYFLYTLLAGPDLSGNEVEREIARFQDPLGAFRDGFQQQDLGAVAFLIIKLAGFMVAGGLVTRFIARRLGIGSAA